MGGGAATGAAALTRAHQGRAREAFLPLTERDCTVTTSARPRTRGVHSWKPSDSSIHKPRPSPSRPPSIPRHPPPPSCSLSPLPPPPMFPTNKKNATVNFCTEGRRLRRGAGEGRGWTRAGVPGGLGARHDLAQQGLVLLLHEAPLHPHPRVGKVLADIVLDHLRPDLGLVG